MAEWTLTAALVVCVAALELVGRRLRREPDNVYTLIVIAVCLGLMIWVPSWIRTLVVGAVVVFLGMESGVALAAVLLSIAIATGVWLPGGLTAVLLVILVLVGIGQVQAARRHLVRLSRAATLVANEPTTQEVELTGKIRAVTPVVDPVHGKPCAMWKLVGRGTRESETLVELCGATGSAIIDPATVRLEWSQAPEAIRGDDAKRAAAELRLDLADHDMLFLQTLAEGTECYVVGVPAWEIAPANTVGLYRDAPVLPTFRSTPEHPAWFADRSEDQLRADHRWELVSWCVWGAMCAAIATVQIAGLV